MKINEKLSILLLLEHSKASKDGKAPITIRITIDGQRAETSLSQKILPALWDQDAQQAAGRPKEVGLVNEAIDKAKTKLRQLYGVLELQNENVTAAMLKAAYKGKTTEPQNVTLLEATRFVIEKMEKKVKKELRAKATLTKWETTEKKIKIFLEHAYEKDDLLLKDLKYSFAEDFIDYLMLDEDIQSNSAMKYLKNVKHIVKTAVERDWLLKSPIASFPCYYVHPERDILNIQELLSMHQKNIEIQRLAEVRDAFVFMCFTGYAYKDTSILSRDNVITYFNEEEWIVKNREKTWCRENVPLLPIAKEIIEKYRDHPYCVANNLLLPINSNQKYNAYLKELADICGIKKNLTTHVARHTFATTVTLANGVPIETVSALLGHTSIKTTQIYAKIVAEKVSMDMEALKERLVIKMPASLLVPAAAA